MAIYSMTGFANVQLETPLGILAVELRSVNHRYLELQLRLDDVLRPFETLVRKTLSKELVRGKVECRISLVTPMGLPPASQLSTAGLEQLARLNQAVRQRFPDSSQLSVADILRAPGVLITEEISSRDLEPDLLATLHATLAEMTASRSREGDKLAALIVERATQIDTLIEKVKPLMPSLIKAYQDKLAVKLHELMEVADENRIHQELAIFAQKIDIDEELGRLCTHLQELRRILAAGGAIGKRLDFLMQELNREANTLGSKSVAAETSQVAMDLKVLIEQMREQVQNIE